MAETAESVVISIEAQMNTTAVVQGTRVLTGAMSDVERSANQAEGAVRTSANKIVESHTRMGASGMILQHVIRGTTDQFAAGAPLAQIFAQHIAMLGEAAALGGESMGKFGAVMAGPWGIAITAGIGLLTALIAGHRGAGDAAKEHETFEQTLIRALHGEADAVDKITESMQQRNDQVREAIALDTQRIARQQADAGLETQVSQNELTRLRSEIATARSDLAAAQVPHVGRAAQEAAAGQALEAQARITSLTAQIAAAEAQLSGVQGRERDTHTQQDRDLSTAEGRVKPIFDRIQAQFEEVITRQRAAAAGNPAELARINAIATVTENQLAQARQNGTEAARRQDDAQRQLNRDYSAVPFSEVRNRIIANEAPASLGGYNAIAYNTAGGGNSAGVHSSRPITDMTIGDVLSFQANVMRPLTRGHRGPGDVGSTGVGAYQFESGTLRQNAREALGPGFMSATLSPENQDRIAENLYNRVRSNPAALRNTWAAFQPGHQGAGDNAASEAERQAREAAQLAERRRQGEEHFQEELTGLNADLANARRQQIQTVQQAADFEIQQIEEQRVQKDQRLQAEADARSREDEANRATYQAEARRAIAINDQTAEIRKGTVRARTQQQLDEQRITIAQNELRDQESIVQARTSLARTVAERRDLELELLGYQHRERILAIQKERQQQNLDPDQRAQLDRDEAAENTRYGLAQEGVRRQNQGPLGQFFDQVPRGAAEMNEALQHVAVDGLTQLNDGLAQAASRFLHLGGIAGHVLDQILSDLVRIVLQEGEMAAFGGSKGGGFSGFLASLAQLAGSASGSGSTTTVPKMAGGGFLPVGGNGGLDQNSLSINGQRRAMVDDSETIAIVPQGKALSFGGGRAASSAPQITVISAPQFDLRGVVTTPQLMREIDRVSRAHAAAAATAMGQGVMKAVPARLMQYQTDGR